jgi:glycerate 2-kinase
MKIIIAPDKFKGTLTSMQVCENIREGLLQAGVRHDIELFPMADGGDGFAEVMKFYLHTQTIYCNTVDPLFRNIRAAYEWDASNKTAVIELAAAAGLVLLKEYEQNPLHTSTYGTGLMIADAVKKGAEKIILGLGGSATNDAGIGILTALGFELKDKAGTVLKPVGKNLSHIKKIDSPGELPSITFIIASDVTNVLYGKTGAALVYATQKGANENEVQLLENGLRDFAAVVKKQTAKDIASFPGSGAAGGVAAGMSAFINLQVQSGATVIMEAGRLPKRLPGTGIIITGEGKIDTQTLNGKVVQQVATLGKRHHIPVIAVCGINELDEKAFSEAGLNAVYPVVSEKVTKENALANAAALVQKKAVTIARNHLMTKK